MVKKILSERHTVKVKEYTLTFTHVSDPDDGYLFDADKNGNVKFDPEYEETQRKNYELCMASPDYEGPEFGTNQWSYVENAKAICECGAEIELRDDYMGACECEKCGRWHNTHGQTLLPPGQWETEA